MNTIEFNVPKEVLFIVHTLKSAGFEAYLVGGCVRDLMRGVKPRDWDITTNARPEDTQSLFPHTFYENDFGTVGIVNETATDPTLQTIEVTTYRLEASYSNNRHPDHVSFSKNLNDDLKRRDFTINTLAYDAVSREIIDLFGGVEDLNNSIIQTVGNAGERFGEDALRMMRAVRLAAELDFSISEHTKTAIADNAHALKTISIERIRDEFERIIMSSSPQRGIQTLSDLGIMMHFIPELEHGKGIEQRGVHIYDVWEHLLRSVQHAADKGFSRETRLAALFHDIGKPKSRRFDEKNNVYTFFGHEVIGARQTKAILERLKFSRETIQTVCKLVRWHMFFSDTETISLSAVRRMIVNVGKEHIWALMDLRVCDRIGTGRPKEEPYRLRRYHAMIEEALRDPISVSMLKINGNTLIEELGIKPSPRIGHILHALLEDVLDDPKRNTKEYLLERTQSLLKLSDAELEQLGISGKNKKDENDADEISKIHKKHRV